MRHRRRKSAALLLALCLHACPVNAARAQQTAQPQTARPVAAKFDEFGDVPLSDIGARLDAFANALREMPQARGFVIAYRSRRDLPGLSGRLMNWMRSQLVNTNGLPAERIAGVDGGVAGCILQELWIVPPGAAPAPRRDAYQSEFEDTDSTRKFDESAFHTAQSMPESYSQTIHQSLEGFANALRRQPRASGYLIAYAGHWVDERVEGEGKNRRWRRQVHAEAPGTAKRELARVKASLVNDHGIRAARIKVVDGGHRKWSSMELWIVPPGQHAPIPTPSVFPKGRR